MTATEALERRIDELCCENARLRERLVHMELHECPGCRNVADLQAALAENTKLRELIADIHALDDLCYIPSWSLDEYGVRMADIERRMRELGLEVDG